MTPKQTELARQALGFDGTRMVSCRNSFAAVVDAPDGAEWRAMAAAGLARSEGRIGASGRREVFCLLRSSAESVLKPDEVLHPQTYFPATQELGVFEQGARAFREGEGLDTCPFTDDAPWGVDRRMWRSGWFDASLYADRGLGADPIGAGLQLPQDGG